MSRERGTSIRKSGASDRSAIKRHLYIHNSDRIKYSIHNGEMAERSKAPD